MTFGLTPGKLGFKLGDVLIGLQSGTTDVPESIASTQNKLHTLGYVWNPNSMAYEVVTSGGSGVGLEVQVTNFAPAYAVRLDVTSATNTYVGKALPGVASSSATWRVQRLTSNAEGDLTIEYADGNSSFDNVWDNRASLSYS